MWLCRSHRIRRGQAVFVDWQGRGRHIGQPLRLTRTGASTWQGEVRSPPPPLPPQPPLFPETLPLRLSSTLLLLPFPLPSPFSLTPILLIPLELECVQGGERRVLLCCLLRLLCSLRRHLHLSPSRFSTPSPFPLIPLELECSAQGGQGRGRCLLCFHCSQRSP